MSTRRQLPQTRIVDVAPSTNGYTYQTDDGCHHQITSGTQMKYTGDVMRVPNEERRLLFGRTYRFVHKRVDDVYLDCVETGVRKRLTREAFVSLVSMNAFTFDHE